MNRSPRFAARFVVGLPIVDVDPGPGGLATPSSIGDDIARGTCRGAKLVGDQQCECWGLMRTDEA